MPCNPTLTEFMIQLARIEEMLKPKSVHAPGERKPQADLQGVKHGS